MPVLRKISNVDMKLFLLIVLAIFSLAIAQELAKNEHDYMYFPDGNGIPHLIDLKQAAENLADDPLRNIDTITFTLFTQSNPTNGQILTLDAVDTVTSSNWDHSRPTRFITHGWSASESSDACVTIRDAYLTVGDYNVIVIDWSKIASALYVSAAGNVKNVAAQVSRFINFMSQNAGLNGNTTILIGHSLGGHIVGIAAQDASETISAVVGLDPAFPLFSNAGAGNGIHKSDANHVQVIHTSAGLLGIKKAMGDSDFFPNGGKKQPGCGLDLFGNCAHGRAFYYFAESIVNPTGFPAVVTRSADLSAFEQNFTVYMGGQTLSTHASGSYTLTTGSKSPFALG